MLEMVMFLSSLDRALGADILREPPTLDLRGRVGLALGDEEWIGDGLEEAREIEQSRPYNSTIKVDSFSWHRGDLSVQMTHSIQGQSSHANTFGVTASGPSKRW